jgi:hypothetical protein
MTLHIRSTVILFDLELQRIRADTDSLAARARILAQGGLFPENWDRIDIEASARNLREAADKLDMIRERLGMPELCLEAAE